MKILSTAASTVSDSDPGQGLALASSQASLPDFRLVQSPALRLLLGRLPQQGLRLERLRLAWRLLLAQSRVLRWWMLFWSQGQMRQRAPAMSRLETLPVMAAALPTPGESARSVAPSSQNSPPPGGAPPLH